MEATISNLQKQMEGRLDDFKLFIPVGTLRAIVGERKDLLAQIALMQDDLAKFQTPTDAPPTPAEAEKKPKKSAK